MAYKLKLGKLEIYCDTWAEMEIALQSQHFQLIIPIELATVGEGTELAVIPKTEKQKERDAKIKLSWDAAKEYAIVHHISKQLARSRLKEARIYGGKHHVSQEEALKHLEPIWATADKADKKKNNSHGNKH